VVAPTKVYGATRAPVGDADGVSDVPHRLHVDLEFEVGSDPIRGRLGPNQREQRDFHGWIELAAALEALMQARAEHPTPASEPR
jgi:hypothetical protein